MNEADGISSCCLQPGKIIALPCLLNFEILAAASKTLMPFVSPNASALLITQDVQFELLQTDAPENDTRLSFLNFSKPLDAV